jgi:hypothetical protein
LAIVFMPPEHHCSKRSANVYGFEKLVRRGDQITETPISAPQGQSVQTKQKSSKPQNFSPSATALAAHVPAKYLGKDSCERATQNCTGHGTCVLLYKDNDGSQDHEYFGCSCNKPEVRTNADGSKKTTFFGGNACHKKDVVAPFWLLASTAVFLVTIVSLALGLLYSMGAEELPSVIGAGVSGPKPR